MPQSHLVIEHSPAGFTRLLLDRAERRNALDVALARSLRDAFAHDRDTPVLLASTDPQVFSAGADLSLPVPERAAVSDLLYECYELMVTRPGPVIAAVSGSAVGGGAQLAAAADLRIAGPAARLRWAGPPGGELAVGAWVLPGLLSRGIALELTMTGRWVEAQEALDLGLVNRIADKPLAAAEELIAALAARPWRSLADIKNVTAVGGLLDRLRMERDVNRAAWERLLAREGVAHGRNAETTAGDPGGFHA
jgi:enoyl-CoA hydratase